MALVYILGPAYPLRGGLATYNERLAREFQKNGDQVVIHTFSLQYPSILFPGKSQYSSSPPPENLEIISDVNSINPLNWIRTGRKIKKIKPDLLILAYWLPFMGPCLGTIARIVRQNRHTRIISTIHNLIPHEKRTGDRIFTKYFLSPVEGFIAQSKTVMNDLEKFQVQNPVIYSPHPLFDNFGEIIDKGIAKKSLELPENSRYILFFGFIRDYKGLDLLLQAMADRRIKDMGINLIIAGEYYSNSKHYRDIIDKHQLHSQVIEFNEFIPDEEVYKYFNACDVVVQPYKSATQSGVTQIAYHFNKPMIVTNVGGLPEIIPDGKVGFVITPEPQAIADAIVKFYQAGLENEFTANAKEEKKKYSWKVMVQNIEQLAAKISK